MILYVPNNMHSSQLTHIFNKEVIKTFAIITTFANKVFPCHETTYTRLDTRKVCIKKILVTEISMVGCSRYESFNNPSLPQIII
jgi:hypothetical protein